MNKSNEIFFKSQGYELRNVIKNNKVFLASKNNALFIIKKIDSIDECDKYHEIYEKWLSSKNSFKRLLFPRYFDIIGDFQVIEYSYGYQIPWSEISGESNFGGVGISKSTVIPIIELANDLSRLNVKSDFYWRNFIFTGNKIAVVDWELENFESCVPTDRLAYIYLLMFNNNQWRREFISKIKSNKSISREQFRLSLKKMLKAFKHQWEKHPSILKSFEKLERIIGSDISFEAIWNGFDIEELLSKVGYHVFDDLGQTHERLSQIDCRGKLEKLELSRLGIKGKRILDIGCNTGWFMKEFAAREAREVVGLDIENTYCVLAAELLKDIYQFDNFSVINMDILFIEDSKKFDLVASISMFHYIEKKECFFEKVSKLVKKKGVFLLETPTHMGLDDVVIWDLNPKRYIPSKNYIERMAKSFGFDLDFCADSNLKDRIVFHFVKL